MRARREPHPSPFPTTWWGLHLGDADMPPALFPFYRGETTHVFCHLKP